MANARRQATGRAERRVTRLVYDARSPVARVRPKRGRVGDNARVAQHLWRPVAPILLLLLMGTGSACRSGGPIEGADPAPGISDGLARERARAIGNVRYNLSFSLPAAVSEPVEGRITIRLTARTGRQPLVLDFAPGAENLTFLAVGGKPSKFRTVNGHLIIPSDEVVAGENVIDIAFRAGDAALNRNSEFLYTLFVPARAHLTFPCFDQPDLKARFTLELTGPADWQAVANAAEAARELSGDRFRVQYAETEPIPTYLFAFAAGKFQVETASRSDRTFRMFHRETDAAKVLRNREALFDLHAQSLDWLERYTALPYRFGKFDFVLVPSFQFTGMEHPGAIFYNSSSLLLDESATENQMLARASVIAHETSHMWFGDLVTMRWFDDVWMKEVFANFMAAKIVNPAFPSVNHELRFLVAHYPAAYSVDRTGGTHPIRQTLANLSEAGSLYGPIIYQKAPIVMRQLERLMGAERLQDGLRAYLQRFQFGNATWPDLVEILDVLTDLDVAAWSRTWVGEAGRPAVATELEVDSEGRVRRLAFVQRDPQPGRSLAWTEQMDVLLGTVADTRTIPVELQSTRAEVPDAASSPRVEFVLPTGGGLAYGAFALDAGSRTYLLRHAGDLADATARGAVWITLWDEMLDRRVSPAAFVDAALRALARERVEQNVQLLTGYLAEAFWTFLSDAERAGRRSGLEAALRAGIARSPSASMKSTFFSAFYTVVTTPEGVAFLERVWRRQEKIPGLRLAETDEATMALELAVRGVAGSSAILEEQLARFENPDRKARFAFVMPAVSDSAETRDRFFESLSNLANRRREPWVVEGLKYMNHPMRAAASLKHLPAALELLREIQGTGDIFFPKNWMDATLNGHHTRAAADIVRTFLARQNEYPVRLQRIILQAADDLFRAADIVPPI
jgi:aminopeptidase N